jgi:monooxygenase
MTSASASHEREHVDVLIVGAGVSGIGAAYYLQREHPQRSYAILEARDATGGTWDLFRFPGIRSDSDLHTFGYEFRPWRDELAIAGGDKILAYLRETAAEYGIEAKVRFRHAVSGASWSSADARWTVDVQHPDTGDRTTLTCNWLFSATGYYRYDEGFNPTFPGQDRFRGPVVHPQYWPADLDYAGKRVLVIGSGSTAVTLVPAMAKTAAHVTMLQRTPSYILPAPAKDPLANRLNKLLGEQRAFPIIRGKNIAVQQTIWRFCQRYPRAARRLIRRVNVKRLPAGFPVDEHFNPPYGPWDQRLCFAPNGDFFRAIRNGNVSMVTDHIATFTEDGVQLRSGRSLEADVIVTATGLNVLPFGGIKLSVDGAPVHLPDTLAYKGLMLSGVPNFAYAIGYTNSSWTLKVGLLCQHFCRLLSYMDANGYDTSWAEPVDSSMPTRPLLDFAAGYVQRVIDQLPRQGNRPPWQTSMSYHADVKQVRRGSVDGPELHFERGAGRNAATAEPAATTEIPTGAADATVAS